MCTCIYACVTESTHVYVNLRNSDNLLCSVSWTYKFSHAVGIFAGNGVKNQPFANLLYFYCMYELKYSHQTDIVGTQWKGRESFSLVPRTAFVCGRKIHTPRHNIRLPTVDDRKLACCVIQYLQYTCFKFPEPEPTKNELAYKHRFKSICWLALQTFGEVGY